MAANQETGLKTDEFVWKDYPILETFKSATNTFVKNIDGDVQIWTASRDWFMEEWGRDTFISLPGILLVNGRFEEAREIFKRFARFEKNGLIPNRIQKDNIVYNSVDASMWFIQAIKSYLNYTKDWKFVQQMHPTIRNIIDNYI